MALRAAYGHEIHRSFQSRDRQGAVSAGQILRDFPGSPLALRAACGMEVTNSFQSRDRQGVPMALRAAYGHESHSASVGQASRP